MTWDGTTPIGRLPELAARRWGDREALMFRGQRFGFSELSRRVDQAARGLMALGIEPGDKVGLWLVNSPDWVVLLFALSKIGAIQVPINTRFRTADLEYVLQQADCAMLIADAASGPVDYLEMVRAVVPPQTVSNDGRVDSDAFPMLRRIVIRSKLTHAGSQSLAELDVQGAAISEEQLAARADTVQVDATHLIMYTSGTLGFPKGVMRTHRQLVRHHLERISAQQISSADVYLNYLPLFHVFGYVDGPITSMLCGSRQVLMERFEPDEALALIEAERVSTLGGFETHLNDLSDSQEKLALDLSSLRVGLFATGGQSATTALQRARSVLAPLRTVTVYGTTEIGANVTLSRLDSTEDQALRTSGRPSGGVEIRIVDPDSGSILPAGESGEIQLTSTGAMQGYYKKDAETRAAYTDDGWYRSGDRGYLREDGYLHFVGRLKDMLKIGGENVDPMEVEAYLLRHPHIREAAVVSCPDPRLTEVAVAFVVPRAGHQVSEADVLGLCKGKIASFKVPRRVWVVDELPMTASGKVQKEKLRARAREDFGSAPR